MRMAKHLKTLCTDLFAITLLRATRNNCDSFPADRCLSDKVKIGRKIGSDYLTVNKLMVEKRRWEKSFFCLSGRDWELEGETV